MNMIVNLLLFGFGALMLCCVVLAVMCIVHYTTNPYSMGSAMDEIKKICENSEKSIRILNGIMLKMLNCPKIADDMMSIEVADFGDIKLLIAGDNLGKPRLFAFNSKLYSMTDYYHLKDDKRFKKFGLKFSLSAEELGEFLTEVSKKAFKNKLDEQMRKSVIDHFNSY